MDIPLQETSSGGKKYSKLPADNNYEIDETYINDNNMNNKELSLNNSTNDIDNDTNNDNDKQKLLKKEEEEEIEEEIKKDKTIVSGGGLPWKKLFAIYFIVWTESAVMNGFNPIIPGMCRNRFKMSEDVASIASGFLVGGYNIATFLSSFFIGHLSDIYGRQKFMLIGSGVGALCSVGFGLAQWFWLAFLLRFITGISNANFALTRAVISDIVPRGPLRAQAFGYHGATMSFARAFSSALTGVTSIVIDKNNPLLDDSYFLPAIFAGAMQSAAFVLNILFVPESNKNIVVVSSGSEKNKDSGRSLLAGVKEVKSDKLMQKLILANCISSFGNGAMLLGVVFYFGLEIEKNGLGLNTLGTGILFGWFGLAGVIFQILFYKYLLRKKGVFWLFQFGNMSLAIGCILMPSTSILYANFGESKAVTVLSWIVASLYCCVLAAGFMTCLPVITTMINNCATPERQGLISGTAQSLSNLLRSFGPILCGVINAAAVSIKMPILLFIFLSLIYLSSYALLRFGVTSAEKSRISETDKA